MQGCYSYVTGDLLFKSYATVIANGTSLCAATYVALSTPSTAAAPITPTAAPSTPVTPATSTPTTGAGSRMYSYGAYCFSLTSALVVALLMVSF